MLKNGLFLLKNLWFGRTFFVEVRPKLRFGSVFDLVRFGSAEPAKARFGRTLVHSLFILKVLFCLWKVTFQIYLPFFWECSVNSTLPDFGFNIGTSQIYILKILVCLAVPPSHNFGFPWQICMKILHIIMIKTNWHHKKIGISKNRKIRKFGKSKIW